MLSGNGRHRRPRQAPALLVAAGVTGSAIAIPLLGAASANAADGTTWDKVAECESGGSWSADTGNGYYGGLQISQEDWDKYGGGQYAYSADEASRSQQISVAEKILADRGTTPWATCALLSGLTQNSGSLDVDTGVDESGNAQGSDDSSGSGDTSPSSGLPDSSSSGDSSASDSTGSSGSKADSDSSGDAHGKSTSHPDKGGKGHGTEDDSTGTNTPKSDKSASPEAGDAGSPQGDGGSPTAVPDAGNSDNSQQNAGSWSLVDTGALSSGGRHRGESADENVTNGQDSTSTGRHASREADDYTVRQGDSLASVAESLAVEGGWRALYADNKKEIGSDPNRITAGQTLEIGTETDAG
ncbi:Transglycosylase-like domain-containing protein [Streptomyces sp. 2231.1]|uniref:LysM peptidoglycan-binding domain-containing protein n=1 Tax=Streptomyces sp. 2231.1 TaxID=1855347 RepID=UPI00089D1025|nr:transglycosylase family protein [Streptomyces sp. 2231.1]SED58739.1 Transglycosylase-like domain-containing protein [Streptomyces sp. 2231.1]